MEVAVTIGLIASVVQPHSAVAEVPPDTIAQVAPADGVSLGAGDFGTDFEVPDPSGQSPFESFIYGGSDAGPGDYPYMVTMVSSTDSSPFNLLRCGGSLISPSWVLTAGHCTGPFDPFQLDVIVGEYDLASVDPQNRIRVAAIYEHPGYVPSSGEGPSFIPAFNDISLMKLTRPVYINTEESAEIDVIRVLGSPQSVAGSTLAGWGFIDGAGTFPTILQAAPMDVLSDATCVSGFGALYDSPTNLCVQLSVPGTTCQGDSGGPLAVFEGASVYQTGLVSWGPSACNGNFLTVFTDVSVYRDWIRTTVTEANDAWEESTFVQSVPFWTSQLTTSTSLQSWELTSVSCADQDVPIDSTVWYKIVPSFSGTMFASTQYSDYDTVLIVNKFEDNLLTPIACNDDESAEALTSNMSFDVMEGATYYVQVAGYSGDMSEGSLTLYIDQVTDPAPTPPPPTSLYGKGDLVALVDTSTGQWHLRRDTGSVVSLYYGNPGDYPIMGDWDGDGFRTLGMYRQSDGYVYLKNSNAQGVADLRFFFGNPGDIPITGDFNGDGFDTVSIYRPSNQTFYIINELGKNDGGLGPADFAYVFGDPGDKPFVGDFDGDGIDTVGLHRESTGLVYFRNSHAQGNADAQFIFGDPGDRFVAGDWDNSGVSSPALFRSMNTTMYFKYSNTQGNADDAFIMGESGWIPVMWNS